jgi:hypothetical protein
MTTLVEICEPLFQYVCRLNRLGRKGGRVDWGIVRGEIKGILSEMRQRAEQTPGMAGPYAQVEQILIFFADSMILNSKLPPGWKPISHDLGELGFEEKFWDLLEEALKDPSESASMRLPVFYVCIGLGFTGLYTGQPDYIRRKMLEISARMRGMIDADQAARICPDAYEKVDTRNLTLPPNRSLGALMVALVVMVAMVLVGYVQLFRGASRELTESLNAIVQGATER